MLLSMLSHGDLPCDCPSTPSTQRLASPSLLPEAKWVLKDLEFRVWGLGCSPPPCRLVALVFQFRIVVLPWYRGGGVSCCDSGVGQVVVGIQGALWVQGSEGSECSFWVEGSRRKGKEIWFRLITRPRPPRRHSNRSRHAGLCSLGPRFRLKTWNDV
jgi:hypothetical protein